MIIERTVKRKWQKAREDCTRNFTICMLHENIRVIKSRGMQWAGHVTCMTGD